MIRELVLVRHGDAEFVGPEGTDASRRLTKKGREVLQAAYPETFARLRDVDDVHLWVSPAVRAVETAELVEGAGVHFVDKDVHKSLYEQDDDGFIAELEAEGEGCVVAVGHIPFMERMLYQLTGDDIKFGKGAVASVTFKKGELRRGRLSWFIQGPKA